MTFYSFSEAREHFKNVLDAAGQGRPVVVRRGNSLTAVVDAERLRYTLTRVCRQAEVVLEAGGWSVFVPGLPVAADGATLAEALDEMVDVIREYAEDWADRLRETPNRREDWALVQLVALSDNDQLKEWLAASTP